MKPLDMRWSPFDAASTDLASGLWRRRNFPIPKPVPKVPLLEWENEGGNLAPAPNAANRPEKTCSED